MVKTFSRLLFPLAVMASFVSVGTSIASAIVTDGLVACNPPEIVIENLDFVANAAAPQDCGTLTVLVIVNNDNGGTKAVSDFPVTVDGSAVVSGAVNTYPTGSHLVAGQAVEGYVGTFSGDCLPQDQGAVTLAANEQKTCVLTENDQPATLTIIKNTIGGDGTFNFDARFNSDTNTPITVTTVNASGTVDTFLNKGNYAVSETVPEGWNFSGISCQYENQSIGNQIPNGEQIYVDNGDHVICTFANTKIVTPVENTRELCSDTIDNDNDELIDLADPDCASFVPPANNGGGGGGGFYSLGGCNDKAATNYDAYVTQNNGTCVYPPKPADNGSTATTTDAGGQVLGASTSCGIYLSNYLRVGYKNDKEAVKKLQKFLNDYLHLNIPLTGIFGPRTEKAVKQFQLLRKETILAPWELSDATGVVWLTTAADINNLMCPDLHLPVPENLIPFSE